MKRTSGDSVVGIPDRSMAVVGVLAALAVVVLVNLIAAKHYRRWDMTAARLYTLSEATIQTLDSLETDVEVDVMLPTTDPLRQSLEDLLTIYRGHTTRLHVQYVDPDRHPAKFAALQQRYGIVTGRTQDGRVLSDTAVIVANGDRHWFITPDDLLDVEDTDNGYTKSRIEQALTVGIRSVLDSERLRACFTLGHGEYSPDDISNRGLSEMRDRLTKNNVETRVVRLDQARASLESCDSLIVVAPSVPFEKKTTDAIAERADKGMDLFLVLAPMADPERKTLLNTGFENLAKRYGVEIRNDVVFERDSAMVVPRGQGEVFFPELQNHPITKALLGPAAAMASMRVMLQQTRSFDITDPALARPLLKTSDQGFGMIDYFRWVGGGGEPKPSPGSLRGPRIVGVAAELHAEDLDRRSRLVLFGSAALVWNENFRLPSRHGNALLLDSALSWLTSKPPIVDVPAKVAPSADLHLTEESLAEILRYVLVFMPLSALLLGVAVRMRRKNGGRQQPDEKPDSQPKRGKDDSEQGEDSDEHEPRASS